MKKQYQLSRSIPCDEAYDLVVIGGGPAGTAAAICAGRRGAKVLLVEATGWLGGLATSGFVSAFDPMADGFHNITGGLMREIVETLYETGGLQPDIDPERWRSMHMVWTPFNHEALKRLLDKLVIDSGVELRLFTKLIDVDVAVDDKSLNGVILHNVEGYRYVAAKAFVDGTGDAVLSDMCGCPVLRAGRDTENIMPSTLATLFTGKSRAPLENQQGCLEKAIKDGFFSQPDQHLPGMQRIGERVYFLNGGHIFGMDPLDNSSLTAGIIKGRELAEEYGRFYQKYVPGCEDFEIIATAPMMGVRESRRIVGEYELNHADYLARRQFDDQIGVFNKFVDVHPYDNSSEEYERFCSEFTPDSSLKPGECVGIPYRILIPKGWRNVWVAGRCVSADVAMHGALRVQPTSVMMGQAAGTAASLAVEKGCAALDVDAELLLDILRKDGAYIPDPKSAEKHNAKVGVDNQSKCTRQPQAATTAE